MLPWNVACSIALEYHTFDGRLQKVANRLTPDGGKQPEQNDIPVQSDLYTESVDGSGSVDGLVVHFDINPRLYERTHVRGVECIKVTRADLHGSIASHQLMPTQA